MLTEKITLNHSAKVSLDDHLIAMLLYNWIFQNVSQILALKVNLLVPEKKFESKA